LHKRPISKEMWLKKLHSVVFLRNKVISKRNLDLPLICLFSSIWKVKIAPPLKQLQKFYETSRSLGRGKLFIIEKQRTLWGKRWGWRNSWVSNQ
jgi:hypothetical protein